ncbi:MAG: hypothetical protein LBP87_03190 [Planctomycetaceae bacterium]|nr:hypothetical protein [Planctomycetaceae bacterium]
MISDQNTLKYDYLLLNHTEINGTTHYHSIFIELKGSDLTRAYQQISATIERFNNHLKGSKLHARVVLSKFAVNYQSNTFKEKFMKKYRCSFSYQCRSMKEESESDGNPSHSR